MEVVLLVFVSGVVAGTFEFCFVLQWNGPPKFRQILLSCRATLGVGRVPSLLLWTDRTKSAGQNWEPPELGKESWLHCLDVYVGGFKWSNTSLLRYLSSHNLEPFSKCHLLSLQPLISKCDGSSQVSAPFPSKDRNYAAQWQARILWLAVRNSCIHVSNAVILHLGCVNHCG